MGDSVATSSSAMHMDTEQRDQLRATFCENWPYLADIINADNNFLDVDLTPLLQIIGRPDRTVFHTLIDCLNIKVAEYDADLTRAQRTANELQAELMEKNALTIQLAKQFSQLSDQARLIPTATSRPRRTTTNPDKFSGNQHDTAKRQASYERWKTQIELNLVTDAACFPTLFEKLTYITSQLSGKAWDAVQDGVKLMTKNPLDHEAWQWPSQPRLWEDLDSRYILLDGTQSAKNVLDTLYQEKRAYGDFKADFDHHATKAKIDDRTKVDMFRKRLSHAISTVINNQVILPALDDWKAWATMADNIARNQQQQDHIAKLNNQNQPRSQQPPRQPSTPADDIMELDRMRLTDKERQRRTDNDLCLACGEKGHYARDHHRRVDPIPMPRPQENQYNRGRGHGYTVRGRGRNYNDAGHNQPNLPGRHQASLPNQLTQLPPGNWQWIPQMPLQQRFLQPQLRAIQQGYVLSDTLSDTASEPTAGSTTGDDSDQLKEPPLN